MTTPEQGLDIINERFGVHPRHRALHAKGVHCKAEFRANEQGSELTRAAHMCGEAVPTFVRLSNGGGDPTVPDYEPEVRGLAVSFQLPDGARTDILCQTLERFPFKDQEGFFDSVRASDRSLSGLARIPVLLLRNPKAIRALPGTLKTMASLPTSFAARSYKALHAFGLRNAGDELTWVRWTWRPTVPETNISRREAKAAGRDYLFDELRERLARESIRMELEVQIAGEGDDPHDPSDVWLADRERVRIGTLEVTAIDDDADDGNRLRPDAAHRRHRGIRRPGAAVPPPRLHALARAAHRLAAVARPPRADIAAPELPPRVRWLNSEPGSMAELTARGPVLVHFFDFAQLNSVRAIPYVRTWHDRYAAAGLSVLGVHSPRFPFTKTSRALEAGIARLGIAYPVAQDSSYAIWRDYGAKGWPSLFLWTAGGALSWFHFGEGEYRATEEAIQEELRAGDALLELPEPMAAIRPSDAPGAMVAPPTEELFPAGGPGEPWRPEAPDEALEVPYSAGGAFAAATGDGVLRVSVDGGPERHVEITGPGLYELTEHARHESHTLRITSAGAELYSVGFPRAGALGEPRVPKPEEDPEHAQRRDQNAAVERLDHGPGEDPRKGTRQRGHRDDRHRREHAERQRRLELRGKGGDQEQDHGAGPREAVQQADPEGLPRASAPPAAGANGHARLGAGAGALIAGALGAGAPEVRAGAAPRGSRRAPISRSRGRRGSGSRLRPPARRRSPAMKAPRT